MRRLLAPALATAILLAAGCGSGSGDATLSVYPTATTVAASPQTGISFRGVAADGLGDLKVTDGLLEVIEAARKLV